MKNVIKKVIEKSGYTLEKNNVKEKYNDINDQKFWDIYSFCEPYTMTSVDRMYALYSAVEYILKNNISGDFVECGVWRGGSSMLIAKLLNMYNVKDRTIYLYDTFEGMSEPTKNDVDISGKDAESLMNKNVNNKETSVWCYADFTDVNQNMLQTNYPPEYIKLIKGKVEDTLPSELPKSNLALLRLDTDWYESTKHELVHLYPLLVKDGVLIIDDYGHWQGCRKAVDEYFEEFNINILLNRIDYTARIGLKKH